MSPLTGRAHFTVAALIAALTVCVALPATASAKKHKKPVEVEAEFSFTGLALYRMDEHGSALTCSDSGAAPYKFEDHVRAHIAWDTTWRAVIPLKPRRSGEVIDSRTQSFHGSTWSIKGKALSGEECVPPKSYACSGTFRAAAKAPIFFSPIEGEGWRALMQGAGGIAARPDGCNYQGVHRRILNELPDEMIDRAVGGFKFTTDRLLKVRNKTKTGDFDYSAVPSDCGSDDTVTCRQSLEGSGGVRYHRVRIIYAH